MLYAVKCNPHPLVLGTLFDAGVVDFDVASHDEIRLVDGLFGKAAGQFFNNPAKSRTALRSASVEFGIRFYTVDCEEELEKVLEEVHGEDVIIAVRLATFARQVRYVLSTKFGAQPEEAARLLRLVHGRGIKAGLSFHVGSQCLSPHAFTTALSTVGRVLDRAGVPISVLNIGGGFPAPYPGDEPPGLETYFSHVIHGRRSLRLPSGCMLLCEPGRSLVATAGTVLVQVIMRRDRSLYLNDGVFGTLQELGHLKERRPVRLMCHGRPRSERSTDFKIYGPTCDSNDVLGAPFCLPEDTREGDWIEVGMMGAYSLSMRTKFNGFFTEDVVVLTG
jgi:ornithine decarboxylase